jgi:hypothetical protein
MSRRMCCCGASGSGPGSGCQICASGAMPDEITVTLTGIENRALFGGCATGNCATVFNKAFVLTKTADCSYHLDSADCSGDIDDPFGIQVTFFPRSGNVFGATVVLQQVAGVSSVFVIQWSVADTPFGDCSAYELTATGGFNSGSSGCQSDGTAITITV